LVPITVILLIDGSFFSALATFSLAGITDALDGFLARVLSQKTVLGAYLDPIADKALLTSCFVTLSIMGIIPGWLAVIVVSRDFIILLGISVLFMASIPFEIRPIFVSKVTTAVQIITVFLALVFKTLGSDGHPLVIHFLHWLTAGFTTLSGFHYILRGIKAINRS
jgi:cardiolipin synthase (CMP-forming)